jgi:hypothetical protein
VVGQHSRQARLSAWWQVPEGKITAARSLHGRSRSGVCRQGAPVWQAEPLHMGLSLASRRQKASKPPAWNCMQGTG